MVSACSDDQGGEMEPELLFMHERGKVKVVIVEECVLMWIRHVCERNCTF
jgi:hypothetical protein